MRRALSPHGTLSSDARSAPSSSAGLSLPRGAGHPGPALGFAPPCLPRAPAPVSTLQAVRRRASPLPGTLFSARLSPEFPPRSSGRTCRAGPRRSAPLGARAPFPEVPPGVLLTAPPPALTVLGRGLPGAGFSLDHSLFLISRTVPCYGEGSTGFWDLRLGLPERPTPDMRVCFVLSLFCASLGQE
jgi:hypothetical protein